MLAITLVLVALNVLLIVLVHARRIRQYVRGGRERRFQAQLDEVMAKLDHPPGFRDRLWLRSQLDGFDELERPLAAAALIERLRPAAPDERRQMLEVLREVGAIDLLVRQTRSRIPWRRALAVRTLGWAGAEETVPVLIGRIGDRSRYVRETAVMALGRIGEPQVLPRLGELFRVPGRVPPGVVYDALLSFGAAAAPTSPARSGPSTSGPGCLLLRRRRGVRARTGARGAVTASRSARSAGAGSRRGSTRAGGGSALPGGLARASRDEVATVRVAATRALGVYDDPQAVELAVNALLDPDRDTAVAAGESLVRLARRPVAAAAAERALARSAQSWPIERALVMDSVGGV